jgi:GT2 family glycosyltransferase
MDLDQKYEGLEGGIREVDLLHGMCTLFPVSVFQTVGWFDGNAYPHLFADDDLVLRAKGQGYRLLVDLDAVVFNDHTRKGLNPYNRRLGVTELYDLVTSRKSAFQISTRTRFLWQHRRSIITFIITWLADYGRLSGIILLRWVLSPDLYSKVEKHYLKIRSA